MSFIFLDSLVLLSSSAGRLCQRHFFFAYEEVFVWFLPFNICDCIYKYLTILESLALSIINNTFGGTLNSVYNSFKFNTIMFILIL